MREELQKIERKYQKMKEKQGCKKCKSSQEISAKSEKEREVFFKER
jgi:hypothetical protein